MTISPLICRALMLINCRAYRGQSTGHDIIHQKQAIVDSLEQAATLWDWGDQPASYSGKEYSRLFKEIMEALT